MSHSLITRQQAAALLGVSLRTITNHINTGVLPAPVSLGGRRVYWNAELFWSAINQRLCPLPLVSLSVRGHVPQIKRQRGRPRKSAAGTDIDDVKFA